MPIKPHSHARYLDTAFKLIPHKIRACFRACFRRLLSVRRLVSIAPLFAWALPVLSATAPFATNNKPPSIVLISVDTLRADRLSCYGYRRVKTSNIDSIAEGGTLFSAIDSQVPLTLPAHVSLFTSTYPFFYRADDNGEALRPSAVTLATILKSRGYRTAAFVGGFVLDRRFGLNQGFDEYDSTFNLSRQGGTDPPETSNAWGRTL